MGMSFWDTVRGYNLADILMYNLPKIAEALQENRKKPQQNVKQMPATEVYDYLRKEFLAGRRLIQTMPVNMETGAEYIVVTE